MTHMHANCTRNSIGVATLIERPICAPNSLGHSYQQIKTPTSRRGTRPGPDAVRLPASKRNREASGQASRAVSRDIYMQASNSARVFASVIGTGLPPADGSSSAMAVSSSKRS